MSAVAQVTGRALGSKSLPHRGRRFLRVHSRREHVPRAHLNDDDFRLLLPLQNTPPAAETQGVGPATVDVPQST